MLLNNDGSTRKSKNKLKSTWKQNENTVAQNLWDATKTILRHKFVAIQDYLKKQEKSQINILILHLKELGKRKTTNKTWKE